VNCNLRIDAIETLPQKNLAGYCAIVSSDGISGLYEKLWGAFLGRIQMIDGLANRDLYGICCSLQANNLFEYWLAVEIRPEDRVPRDLIPFPLLGGTYGASIETPGVSLPFLYNSLIQKWTAPVDYTLDWKMPFFEVYNTNWRQRMAVKICLPLQFSVFSYREFWAVGL
jgi:predicted transcriptional regulator YdeE